MNTVTQTNFKDFTVNNHYDALDRVCELFEKDVLFDTISLKTNMVIDNKNVRYHYYLEENKKYNEYHNFGSKYGIHFINDIQGIIIDLLFDNKLNRILLDDTENNIVYRIRIEY